MKNMKNSLFIKFIIYGVLFSCLSYPFFGVSLKTYSMGVILGFFAGILNFIAESINKK